jgi:bifunctional non-homologous end joining protein LigD
MADLVAEIDGRTVSLSNLDKPMYPDGFTKGEVIDYYLRIAPVLLPHLRDRVVTRVRFPEGSQGIGFFEKNASPGLPDWVRTQLVETSDSLVDYIVVDDAATLVVLANLASLELHTPQWRIPGRTAGRISPGELPRSDQLVIDLDPGEGLAWADQVRATLLVAARLAEDGIVAIPRTSGGKGLQLLAPVAPTPGRRVTAYAHRIGEQLTTAHPGLFVASVAVAGRRNRIFLDYNQNLPGRNTVSVYSLRAGSRPNVSTPLTWDELAASAATGPLRFTASDVLDRVAATGDLASDLFTASRPAIPLVTE